MSPAKTQISLGIRPVWSESSLSAWRKPWSLATHWAHSEDSAQTQISLGIRPSMKKALVLSYPLSAQADLGAESSLCAQWVAKDQGFFHADSEDSDKTGRMPRLIWVFAGHTVILLVLTWGCPYNNASKRFTRNRKLCKLWPNCWICTACPFLSVPKLRIFVIVIEFSFFILW